MQTLKVTNALTIVIAGLIVAACSSTQPTHAPAHRWASTEAVDAVQYRNDHARCQVQADMEGANKAFSSDSPEFAKYKQCMTNRGYVLTAYND